MLDTLKAPDQQGVRDFLTEGVTSLSPLEMHRVLENCGYKHQRPIKERHVAVLTDLMRRGRWRAKSQIDFGILDGRYILVNGYHRGLSQVRSGKTVIWDIALHPVKSDADLRALYYSFDTNVQTRNDRDILSATEFAETNGLDSGMAAALYRAIPLIARRFSPNHYDTDVLTTRQVDRRLEVAAEYAKAAGRYAACLEGIRTQRKKKLMSGAVTAVAVATFKYQGAVAWEFWTGVAQMDGLKRGDARLTLASDFLSRKVNSGQVAAFAPSIIAWNAFFGERPLQIIKVTEHFTPTIDGTPFDGKPISSPLKKVA